MTEHTIFENVVVALRQIIRAMELHSRKLVHDYGLTGPQLAILRDLGHLGEISVGKIAEDVNLSSATVTGILDRLERHGFVLRTRSSMDKRKVLVALTDNGKAVLQRAPGLLQEKFMAQFSNLETWEQTMILSAFQRVASLMTVDYGVELSGKMLDIYPLTSATNETIDALNVAEPCTPSSQTIP